MAHVVPSQVVGFIDEEFSFARVRQPFNVDLQFKDRVSALLRLVDELPHDLVSINDRKYNRFVLAVETMRSTIQLWNSHGVTQPHIDRRLGAAIIDLRASFDVLADQQVPASTAGLRFIADSDLRESIRADIAFESQAFNGREWKAATVLAGAVVEALLLWALHEQPKTRLQDSVATPRAARTIRIPKDSKPEDWTLATYKHIAADLGIVDKSVFILIGLAQEFRNLIHPGKARRTGQQCTAGTAHCDGSGCLDSVREE
jgi:hypothetical protein